LLVESRRGNKYILITVFRGYIHYTPPKSRSSSDYVFSFASILPFFTAHSQPLPSLIVDNETSLECREYFLSQRLPVTFVPPQTHRSNPAERAVRTGKNHLISVFSSTHPDFPDDLWDRLLPYAEITLNVMRSWRPIPPSLPGLASTASLTTSPPTPFTPLANSALPSPTLTTATLGPLTGVAPLLLAQPLPTTGYRCQRVYVVSSRSERITLTLAHFPLPLFHFAESDLPSPPTPDPSATRPFPTLDGTDLIGRVFNDPDLGLCRVVEVGPPHRLVPGEGNLDPTGPQLQAGWVPGPPCGTHRSVGPRTALPSPRWWSGSKPWLPLSFPHPHLYFLPQHFERIAFAIVPDEVRYPDRIVGIALLLSSMQ
jgi:hypothetical protein